MVNYSEASYGKQVLVGLIDALLCVALVTLSVNKMPEVINSYLKDVNGSLLVLVVFVLYRLVSLLFLNQTLGMRLFQVVLLNGEGQPLAFFEKALATIFVLFRGTSYYQVK